jgi:hypothetical protein
MNPTAVELGIVSHIEDLTTMDLSVLTAVELRKLGSAAGIKGAAKGKKADLLIALGEIQTAQRAEKEAVAEPVKVRKGSCNVCGQRRAARDLNGQCNPCYEEGAWKNEHQDRSHEDGATDDACWICHPELNEAKRPVRAGRSRAGMVIVAKGTEVHKSETFRVAAVAAGWKVTIQTETYELEDDATGEGTRHYAYAVKGNDGIALAWDGKAYDYPASSAKLAGKDRKVRNLKEALRLL